MIVIIAMLGAIVIPRIMGASRRARESALKETLQRLRCAAALFQAHIGRYPNGWRDVMQSSHLPPGEQSNWRGPYLTTPDNLPPRDPITGRRDWVYDPASGSIRSAATGTSLEGDYYSDW